MRPSMLGVKDHNGPASVKEEKKLTFEEWLHHRFPAGVGRFTLLDDSDLADTLHQCWKAAQENVPSQAPGTGA